MTTAPAIKRKPLTGKRRAEFFEAHDGRCYLCGEKIKAGEAWDDEHVIQLWVSEDDSLENRRPAHRDTCHKVKTAADAKVRGKVKRIIARNDGTRRVRKPIQSRGFDKTQTRGFDGKVRLSKAASGKAGLAGYGADAIGGMNQAIQPEE